jgi:hypothetical protein
MTEISSALFSEHETANRAARRVLSEALCATRPQAAALVVVGAHAIYSNPALHDSRFPDFTVDADIVVDPEELVSGPGLDQLLIKRFRHGRTPGKWVPVHAATFGGDFVDLDILAARTFADDLDLFKEIAHDGTTTVRREIGLELALLDWVWTDWSLAGWESRYRLRVRVAGPSALLVAKTMKLTDRLERDLSQISSGEVPLKYRKDAIDLLRLLTCRRDVTRRDALNRVRSADSSEQRKRACAKVIDTAYGRLGTYFSAQDGKGCRLLSGYTLSGISAATMCASLVQRVLTD